LASRQTDSLWSALRRVQPDAVTVILTSYPAFQAALRAIHEQVDDFLTKPAEPANLIKTRTDFVQKNLPNVDIRNLLPDLAKVDDPVCSHAALFARGIPEPKDRIECRLVSSPVCGKGEAWK
jgi:DNA-binding NtrC family response regulator